MAVAAVLVTASSAWPTVCRNSRMRRSPLSRSSADTTSALMRHDSMIAGRSTSGSRAKIAFVWRATRSNELAAGDHAVFDDLVAGPSGTRAAAASASRSGSIATTAGWWNAPISVLAERVIDANLAANRAVAPAPSSVVGTCASAMPRRKVAAAKPAVSPITPPPTATIALPRSAPRADERFVDARDRLQVLVALAVGNQDRLGAAPRDAAVCAPCRRQMTGLETMKRRLPTPCVVEQGGKLFGDAVADPDRRRSARAGVDVDADRCAACRCSRLK